MDGLNLIPPLKGESSSEFERSLFWHFPAYLQGYSRIDQQRDPLCRTCPVGVIRNGQWELHEHFEDGGLELYNLDSGPSESDNLANFNTEVRDRLHNALKQ